jgi:hypothetical protein
LIWKTESSSPPLKKLSGRRIVRFASKKLSEELSGEKISGRRTVWEKNPSEELSGRRTVCVLKIFNEELSGRRIFRVKNCPGEELSGRKIIPFD